MRQVIEVGGTAMFCGSGCIIIIIVFMGGVSSRTRRNDSLLDACIRAPEAVHPVANCLSIPCLPRGRIQELESQNILSTSGGMPVAGRDEQAVATHG
jgi:hypothetical protein